MEISPGEAEEILHVHKIEVSDLDPRSPVKIATQFIMTGQISLGNLAEKSMDSVARIQAEIAWPRITEATSRAGSLS